MCFARFFSRSFLQIFFPYCHSESVGLTLCLILSLLLNVRVEFMYVGTHQLDGLDTRSIYFFFRSKTFHRKKELIWTLKKKMVHNFNKNVNHYNRNTFESFTVCRTYCVRHIKKMLEFTVLMAHRRWRKISCRYQQ